MCLRPSEVLLFESQQDSVNFDLVFLLWSPGWKGIKFEKNNAKTRRDHHEMPLAPKPNTEKIKTPV